VHLVALGVLGVEENMDLEKPIVMVTALSSGRHWRWPFFPQNVSELDTV